jgi:hypothetical protein
MKGSSKKGFLIKGIGHIDSRNGNDYVIEVD